MAQRPGIPAIIGAKPNYSPFQNFDPHQPSESPNIVWPRDLAYPSVTPAANLRELKQTTSMEGIKRGGRATKENKKKEEKKREIGRRKKRKGKRRRGSRPTPPKKKEAKTLYVREKEKGF